MPNTETKDLPSKYFDIVEVWCIRIELGPEDDDALRNALNAEIGLIYGAYDHVSFESAHGSQFFRGGSGTVSGEMEVSTSRSVRTLSFSIPRDDATLGKALGLIHRLHSYEEPVVYIQEASATRTRVKIGGNNPRKWWNRP